MTKSHGEPGFEALESFLTAEKGAGAMGRLTKRDAYGEVWLTDDETILGDCVSDTAAMLEKLARYEDAEEQGRLLELPVKIGSKVFMAEYLKGGKAYIAERVLGTVKWDGIDEPRYQISTFNQWVTASAVGITVFVDRAGAEAALGRGSHV